MDLNALAALVAATLNGGTLLALAALGLLINERAGVVNLGAEGMMLVAAIAGFATAVHTGSDTLAFVAAVPRLRAVNPLDAEACGEAATETKRAMNRLVSEHRARHTDLADANKRRREHNARVLNAARVARLPDLSGAPEGDEETALAPAAPHDRFAAPAMPTLRRERPSEPREAAPETPRLTRI